MQREPKSELKQKEHVPSNNIPHQYDFVDRGTGSADRWRHAWPSICCGLSPANTNDSL